MELHGYTIQKKLLERLFNRGELGHAYIFSGPEKIGKRAFAQSLVKEIFSVPKGTSHSLQLLTPESSESGQTISIAILRDAKAALYRTTEAGTIKAVIIDDAHAMTAEAQNALLKLLEEPPSASLIILITAHPDQL